MQNGDDGKKQIFAIARKMNTTRSMMVIFCHRAIEMDKKNVHCPCGKEDVKLR
jgi:hypothetical protein